jgi:hypothetical protein
MFAYLICLCVNKAFEELEEGVIAVVVGKWKTHGEDAEPPRETKRQCVKDTPTSLILLLLPPFHLTVYQNRLTSVK